MTRARNTAEAAGKAVSGKSGFLIEEGDR